ncbi:MAG: hypothetical protein KBG15_23105 [Kofleriaceae bacterium]|nr:hypothetical protein [Kofleriaceae bacterium]
MELVVATLRNAEQAIVNDSLQRFATSSVRFRTGDDPERYRSIVVGLVESFALAGFGGFVVGSLDAREVERAAAFWGASVASEGAGAFDVGALLHAVCDATLVHIEPTHYAAVQALFAWLLLVATDALATAKVRAIREQMADDLETGTPVVLLAAKVPAVFFVGTPSPAIVANIMARALMTVVAASATTLILACDGLSELGLAAMGAAQAAIVKAGFPTVTYIVVGSRRSIKAMHASWQAAGLRCDRVDEIQHAMRDCLVHNGYSLSTSS